MFHTVQSESDIIFLNGSMFLDEILQLLTIQILTFQRNNRNLRVWSVGKLLPFPKKHFRDDHPEIRNFS